MSTETAQQGPSPIVVGIDGSAAALSAAVWAAGEAAQRGALLRLTFVLDSADDFDSALRHLAVAAAAAAGGARASNAGPIAPLAIEVDIQRGIPTERLLDASLTASLICIGAVGTEHAGAQRIGANVVSLAATARCPVAVIRGEVEAGSPTRCVVADLSGDEHLTTVVAQGVEQARLRHAPLHIVSSWRPTFADVQDPRARAAGNRRARAEMERRLDWLSDTHPDVDIAMAAESGSTVNYLCRFADSIGLLVVARTQGGAAPSNDIGPPVHEVLSHADCSVLVCPVSSDELSATQ